MIQMFTSRRVSENNAKLKNKFVKTLVFLKTMKYGLNRQHIKCCKLMSVLLMSFYYLSHLSILSMDLFNHVYGT